MANKELRKMNRTELIEIIYALQQNEKTLRAERDQLRAQLDDKLLTIQNAGSIAEAALALNHLFQDAENAARQYLLSVQHAAQTGEIPAEIPVEIPQISIPQPVAAIPATPEEEAQALSIVEQARKEASAILARADLQAADLLQAAKSRADAIEKENERAREEQSAWVDRMADRKKQFEVTFLTFIEKYPDLAAAWQPTL